MYSSVKKNLQEEDASASVRRFSNVVEFDQPSNTF